MLHRSSLDTGPYFDTSIFKNKFCYKTQEYNEQLTTLSIPICLINFYKKDFMENFKASQFFNYLGNHLLNKRVNKMPTQASIDNIYTPTVALKQIAEIETLGINLKKNIYSISNLKVTKESFEALLSYTSDSLITTVQEFDTFYESFIHKKFYASYKQNKDSFYITTAIMFEEDSQPYKDLIERVKKPLSVKWATGIDSSGSVVCESIELHPPKQILKEAYPFFDCSIEELVQDFLDSDESVLILFGPPGTGKSKFIEHLIDLSKKKAMFSFNQELMKSDKLYSHFVKSDCDWLINEDADTYISSRNQHGNETMKMILNCSDGLATNKTKKYIFSTNLPNLNDVDEALLRPGRCYGVINFTKLNSTQAQVVASKLNPNIVLEDKGYSLAEIYAATTIKRKKLLKPITKTSMGFIPN